MTFIYPIHNFAFSCSKSYAINMINQTVIETKNLHILMSTFPIYHNHLYWKTAIIFVSFSALPAVLTSVSQLGYKSCMVYWGLQNAFNLTYNTDYLTPKQWCPIPVYRNQLFTMWVSKTTKGSHAKFNLKMVSGWLLTLLLLMFSPKTCHHLKKH